MHADPCLGRAVSGERARSSNLADPLFRSYILIGGMRASLLADYVHCIALYSIIVALMSIVFAQSELIGSPSKVSLDPGPLPSR